MSTKYYILERSGLYDSEKYCYVTGLPEGIDGNKSALKYGGELSGIYPEDAFSVTMNLDEDSPKHVKKGDFVGTSGDLVMISSTVVAELKNYNIGKVEFWPFTLVNHKGKEHSRDYSFVVPLNQFDAVDEENSKYRRDENGIPLRIRKLVLDGNKLEGAPDMFRVNDLRRMAFSEKLAEKLMSDYTNFAFEEVDIS